MAEISKWASYNNHTIIGWYMDLAISGKDVKNRPEFLKISEDIKAKAEGIVAYRLDRLGRSVLDLLMLVKLICEDLKKSLYCVADNIDSKTSMGTFFIQILAAIAELQRNYIRENVEAGRDRRREEQKSDPSIRLGGPAPKEINQKLVIKEIKKGNSPERIGKLIDPVVSGATVRRRMQFWGIYEDYKRGNFLA